MEAPPGLNPTGAERDSGNGGMGLREPAEHEW
jgi:hypothetical protein